MRLIERGLLGSMLLFSILIGYADVVVYGGAAAKDSGLQLQAWGNGKIEETEETRIAGSYSLKVTTLGAFAGGWLAFEQAPDLRAAMNEKDALLRFTLLLPSESGYVRGGGVPGGYPGGYPGGLAGAGGLAPGGGIRAGGAGQVVSSINKLRVVVETTDGKLTEFALPLEGRRADARGWMMVGIPLSAIPNFKETSGQIRRIGVFGDTPATFYLGEIRTATDQTPITGRMIVDANGVLYDSQNPTKVIIAAGDELIFYGVGEAGSTVLSYRWNFGSGKPDEVDAETPAIRRRFPKAGDYTVTLTIADQYGIKKPLTTSISIQVN